jgi:hypothetical protein
MLKVNLSADIMTKINNNNIKAKELISFILNNVANTSTTKDINSTALKDISFNGQYAKSVKVDTWHNELIINF